MKINDAIDIRGVLLTVLKWRGKIQIGWRVGYHTSQMFGGVLASDLTLWPTEFSKL